MSTPSRRTHQGCWTCKARRRKCDRARPTCQACRDRGLACEGYEIRLQWGTGIASRGRFTGADAPVQSSIPPRVQGRQRDRSRERRRQLQVADQLPGNLSAPGIQAEESRDVDVSPLQSEAWKSRHDAGLFNDFLSWGINILHSTTVHDGETPLKLRLPTLCQQSEALYRICVTLQVSLRSDMKSHFFEYFDAALNNFRSELAQSEAYLKDGTLTAGLLLCTIGVTQGIPWTMHLRGMYNILQSHGSEQPRDQTHGFRAHLLEVMGIMDLPTFAIGRQCPYLGFWRRYCRNRSTADLSEVYDVEVVSGLPRSLVDIFSCVGEGATEEDFWNWPGAEGTFSQCQLWEAYRLAGMLVVRHGTLRLPLDITVPTAQLTQSQNRLGLPTTAVIITRLLSCIDAVWRVSLEAEAKEKFTINAIPYPVFVAGLQTAVLDKNPGLREFVRKILAVTGEGPFWNRQYRLLLNLLEEYWTYPSDTVSIHELAQLKEIEVGLF
ncbi:Zn(II)2Cys6 transcription factor [Aspergillus ibericus CBS 121593]|uniref:C6 finger domain protein n=1 Tax=Aspergillus ibericus CBS 121593 TaxID=1448316 RepID=A0A395GJ46_9EURO|nr:C6 finger domain protein [Aspergillus ibericus CBS 121593]RAK95302.1 C6 finger domain protein [Aspergillus ibericus CBS 121593]